MENSQNVRSMTQKGKATMQNSTVAFQTDPILLLLY